MRIITGTARGCKLLTLEGEATRPTLEKAKESIFSAIQFDIEGRFVLDLFAGSGQIGLEALSRGADKAVLCDNSSDAVEIIRQNAQKTKLYQKCKIIRSDYLEYLKSAKVSGHKFNLVFLDPPYESDYLSKALKMLIEYELLSPNAIIIAESNSENIITDELSQYYNEDKTYRIGKVYFAKLSPKADEQ